MRFPESKRALPHGTPDGCGNESSLHTSFDKTELETLRAELLGSGLDTWQAGELVSSFLTARGYGVSAPDARSVASRIESESCTLECMRHELGKFALFM